MSYERGDVVILPFPFATTAGVQQKARPALVISDHSIRRRFNDVILLAITSRIHKRLFETEYLIKEGAPGFKESGLKKSSAVRGEFIITVPEEIVARKIGHLCEQVMIKIDRMLKISLGIE